MSKSTETTNDRVPRVLVRFGKHPSSVWKHPSSVWKHTSSVGKHTSSVGKHHRAWGNIIERGETSSSVGKRGALPKAKWRGVWDSRNEGTRGVGGGLGAVLISSQITITTPSHVTYIFRFS